MNKIIPIFKSKDTQSNSFECLFAFEKLFSTPLKNLKNSLTGSVLGVPNNLHSFRTECTPYNYNNRSNLYTMFGGLKNG
ncbi:hypothetical protein BHECKSOX_1880 [Bathymodiolus heckerae thiotrophic gill symbiont]|nr:hypothetical protein BHECKSOX_1880 [Bathymodiolus heckerae thiotrophic gill symbiont]